MKDTLLNTLNSPMTIMMCLMLIMGSFLWTSNQTTKPFFMPKPNLKMNIYM